MDQLIAHGLQPWICLCYGNGLYSELAAETFGAVGIRSYRSNISFDNFAVVIPGQESDEPQKEGSSFTVDFNDQTVTSANYGTTMQSVLQTVNAAWDSFTEVQQNAVKTLCDQYLATVSTWGLNNIYPTTEETLVA